MSKFSERPEEKKEWDAIFNISCNHRRIEILIRGDVRVLCDMIANAMQNSGGARQILNRAMALMAIRESTKENQANRNFNY